MVRVVEARLRLPLFSIKHPEAFQVRASLPIPQPSTLVGMLAYCLGVATGVGTAACEIVKSWVNGGKLMAARASFLKASLPTTVSTSILRRFRVVDKGYYYSERETGLKYVKAISLAIEKGRLDRVKSILEKDLTDAFYREYVMGHEISCVWALSDDLNLLPEWLRLAHRLGDTESLCTVLNVREVEAEISEKDVVETGFPAHLDGSLALEGDYTVVKMCDERFFHTRRGKPRKFAVPCKIEIVKVRGGAVPVITPSKVQVTYQKPVKVVVTAEGDEITAYVPAEKRKRRRRGGR